jgi:hypothetical protein
LAHSFCERFGIRSARVVRFRRTPRHASAKLRQRVWLSDFFGAFVIRSSLTGEQRGRFESGGRMCASRGSPNFIVVEGFRKRGYDRPETESAMPPRPCSHCLLPHQSLDGVPSARTLPRAGLSTLGVRHRSDRCRRSLPAPCLPVPSLYRERWLGGRVSQA